MRVREVFHSRLAKLLKVDGITLYPFIFYAGVPGERLRRHEWQHVLQVREHGWLRFYATYALEYLRNLLKGVGHYTAYHTISYEVEAREVERDGNQPWKGE